jgi:hypothetical protein
MTSELRELVWVPYQDSASKIITSRPVRASALATASPTIPAPITTHSSHTERAFPSLATKIQAAFASKPKVHLSIRAYTAFCGCILGRRRAPNGEPDDVV